MRNERTNGRSRTLRALVPAVTLAGVALAACDFEVINPGPVEDEFLDRIEAHDAVVLGAQRQLAEGLNLVSITTAAVSREVFPAGSTGSFGISNFQQEGIIFWDDTHVSWTLQQRARFTAEDAFRRFSESEDVEDVNSYGPAAAAALTAGYANRLLGENYCEAVIDGGEAQPSSVFLTRAEEWFTQAINIGLAAGEGSEDVVSAGYAGRAAVRVDLGNWAGAVSDAQQVPEGFSYAADYNVIDQDQFNRLFWAGAAQPYKSHSTWNTQWEDYYATTGDPRVAWAWRLEENGDLIDGTTPPPNDLDAVPGDAAVAVVEDSIPNGSVPHFPQMKYPNESADIVLSDKWEMNLIEAENELRAGNIGPAFDLMNLRRADLGIDELAAPATLDEAWTLFKRERGIELWLEARRMNDLRRWEEDTADGGELHPLERRPNSTTPEAPSFLRLPSQPGEAALCYPIPRNERESNENLPLQPS